MGALPGGDVVLRAASATDNHAAIVLKVIACARDEPVVAAVVLAVWRAVFLDPVVVVHMAAPARVLAVRVSIGAFLRLAGAGVRLIAVLFKEWREVQFRQVVQRSTVVENKVVLFDHPQLFYMEFFEDAHPATDELNQQSEAADLAQDNDRVPWWNVVAGSEAPDLKDEFTAVVKCVFQYPVALLLWRVVGYDPVSNAGR